jgi:hypothetical protein
MLFKDDIAAILRALAILTPAGSLDYQRGYRVGLEAAARAMGVELATGWEVTGGNGDGTGASETKRLPAGLRL